ncbi:beta-D-glucan exohydrolase [Canna indica]|uniref:beta-glucosidase n=1 Tax=Canna indica TaxID=4628 RepID=A0AAQ3KGP6_9LILI|nr:beta-D-glucan exohydrolase [Canna indica]
MIWKIRSSTTLPVMHTPWLPSAPSFCIAGPIANAPVNTLIGEFMDRQTGLWKTSNVRAFFPPSLADIILDMEIRLGRDQPAWPHSINGMYTVTSGYKFLLDSELMTPAQNSSPPAQWCNIWTLKAPPKLKYFLWSFCTNAMPVRCMLASRGIPIHDTSCIQCASQLESAVHVFFQFGQVIQVWQNIPFLSPPLQQCNTTAAGWATLSRSNTQIEHIQEFYGYAEDDLTSHDKLLELFESWMEKHSKSYASFAKKLRRFEVFKDNLKHIDETTRKSNDSYWLELAWRSSQACKEKRHVAACTKHYVGDGGTTEGINENNTVISLHGLLSIHMLPYDDAIIQGVSTVMVSYSSWNGVKMHANYQLITQFLKHTLHIMIPFDYKGFIGNLTYLFENNFIPMSRNDEAVRRILRVKLIGGLFENPFGDASLADQLGSQVHRQLAGEAVRKSLVLLKNGKSENEPILPLPKKSGKILVAGNHVDKILPLVYFDQCLLLILVLEEV